MFDPYVAELRKRGLVHLAYFYGFDEIGGEMFEVVKRTYGFLKKRYPEIPTMTTGRDPSFGIDSGLDDAVDIWVPLTPVYDLELAEKAGRAARKSGGISVSRRLTPTPTGLSSTRRSRRGYCGG